MKPHKHADLIKAWAEGSQIQYYGLETKEWYDIDDPYWDKNVSYRIKPEDVWYTNIPPQGVLCWVSDISPHEKTRIGIVESYYENCDFRFKMKNVSYRCKEATPLTKEEILQFL